MSAKNAIWNVELFRLFNVGTTVEFSREDSCNREYKPSPCSLSRLTEFFHEHQGRIDFDFTATANALWVTADVTDLRGELFAKLAPEQDERAARLAEEA